VGFVVLSQWQFGMIRDVSPVPDIIKALFNTYKDPKPGTRKRSSRPSIEEDIQKDLLENKENEGPRGARSKSRTCSNGQEHNQNSTGEAATMRPRFLSARPSVSAEVFQYPSPRQQPPGQTSAQTRVLPRISVHHDDDDVFDSTTETWTFPVSGTKGVLTPSTAHTPVLVCGSTSSQCLTSIMPSPNIDRGVCCSTPNRIKLESEGLSSTEKMVLGRGAFGTVILGKWNGKKVAIKVMEKEAGGKATRRRKSLESELHAKHLDHKNIVKVYDVYAKDNQYALVIMEYVGSRNLHRLLIETRDKPLDTCLLLSAAKNVSSALGHCHSKGIIHLDVKPANILVNSQGIFKLGDFGCSVATSTPALDVDHFLVGTPGYQAPEFLRGSPPSPRCDVYSLAILLWQLDSREVPFTGHHPQAVMYQVVARGVRPPLPSEAKACVNIPAFTSLYKSCWHTDPAARPSCQEIVLSVRKIFNGREHELKCSSRNPSSVMRQVKTNRSLRV